MGENQAEIKRRERWAVFEFALILLALPGVVVFATTLIAGALDLTDSERGAWVAVGLWLALFVAVGVAENHGREQGRREGERWGASSAAGKYQQERAETTDRIGRLERAVAAKQAAIEGYRERLRAYEEAS